MHPLQTLRLKITGSSPSQVGSITDSPNERLTKFLHSVYSWTYVTRVSPRQHLVTSARTRREETLTRTQQAKLLTQRLTLTHDPRSPPVRPREEVRWVCERGGERQGDVTAVRVFTKAATGIITTIISTSSNRNLINACVASSLTLTR